MPSRILRLWNPDASAWEEVGDSRLSAHLADPNGHPVYLTQAEADALYDPLGGGGGGGSGGGMVRIQEQVLSAPAATITFSSIPGTYRTLVLELVGRSDGAGTGSTSLRFRLNGDAGASYDFDWWQGINNTTQSGTGFAQTAGLSGNLPKAGDRASVPGVLRLELPGYAGTGFWKSGEALYSYRHTDTAVGVATGKTTTWWRSTAAVTEVTLYPDAGSFVAGTWCVLYGVDGGASAGLDVYTKAESDAAFLSPTEGDAAYLKLTGGTLTGNLGVGVAPAAWGPTRRVVQVGIAGGLWADSDSTSTNLVENTYHDGTNFRSLLGQPGSRLNLSQGALAFSTAPTVGAGAAQTFTTRLTVAQTGTVTLSPDAGQAHISNGGGTALVFAPGTNFHTVGDATTNLGVPGQRWYAVYASIGSINTSRKEAKQDITPLSPEDALAAVRATDPVTFSYTPPERSPEWYELPDDPEQAASVLEQRMTAAPLEAGARHQAGVVLGHDTYRTDPLFQTGDGQTNASNSFGVLLAAMKAIDARLTTLEQGA